MTVDWLGWLCYFPSYANVAYTNRAQVSVSDFYFLHAITVYTGYVLPYETGLLSLLCHAVCLTIIGMAGTVTWAAAGGLLQKFFMRYYRPFNLLMALVLLWCAASLAFQL